MSKNFSTPPRGIQRTSTPLSERPPTFGRPSILSNARRNTPGSNPTYGSGRTVSFAANPVTMSQSPPQHSDPPTPTTELTPGRGRSESRSASLPPMIRSTASSDETPGSGGRSRSVKHLTCFWWKEKGSCKYAEEECLYAHYDTGRYTDAPRQLNPDEPAKAGRNLARALGDLTIRGHRSTSSLPSSPVTSRPGTPLGAYGARPSTPSMLFQMQSPSTNETAEDIQDMHSQIDLYRSVIETAVSEKALMLDVILDLKTKVSDTDAKMVKLEADMNALTQENNVLKAAYSYQSVGNQFGAVGSAAGLGLGIGGNAFINQTAPSVPAWTPVPVAARPGTPNTNPSDDDGDYIDMRATRRDYGFGR